jgi:hypothetical protein
LKRHHPFQDLNTPRLSQSEEIDWYVVCQRNFQAYREYLPRLCVGDSANKQDMLFEELAIPKRTTYSYGEAVNELLER